MPPTKRQRLSPPNDVQDDEGPVPDKEMDSGLPSSDTENESVEDATDDNLANITRQKSRQTAKRKLRATVPSKFGATLQSLLSTDAPSGLPLSLKPSIARKRNDEKLEQRAKKVLQVEKKEKEEHGRIKDVIGGWGAESERALRKVAQRGVVKLFNVIQEAQAKSVDSTEALKAHRGSGKPTLPAPSIDSGKAGGKGKYKDSAVNKDDFFDMIRSGGIVSTT